jgi:hypothetical protein
MSKSDVFLYNFCIEFINKHNILHVFDKNTEKNYYIILTQ